MTGGAGVNNRRKIFGKLVGITRVALAECEWKLDRRLCGPGQLSVMPWLAIDRRLSARSTQVKDRLSIGGRMDDKSTELGQQWDTLAVGQGEFVDTQ